jgi:PKD repeat protein
MNAPRSRFTAALLGALLLLTQAPVISAQSMENTAMQETLELYVGDIFEIIPVHGLQNASYTWILTQDRTFIEASRSQVFRKRPITPGIYSLYAEISSADQSQHITRTFLLNFKPRVPGQQIDTIAGSGAMVGSGGMLVGTMPMLGKNNSVVLPSSKQLLRIDPVSRDLAPLAADLDLMTDTEVDGNPANDIDTKQTFFQTDATPLYVWLTQPKSQHSMSITAVRPEGAQVQMIKVLDEATGRDQGMNNDDVDVEIKLLSGRTYSFSADTDTNAASNRLLYHWEFGDGKESLLTKPEHEYASDGTYTVKVRIRNLANGEDIASYTEDLTVEAAGTTGPDNGSASSEDTEPEIPSSNGGGIGSITSILLLVGVFLASIIAGVGAIVLISRFRGKGKTLSDRIESMEATIIKKDDKDAKAPTLSIPAPKPQEKPTTPPPSIAKREEDRPNPPATSPKVEEKNAPSWLKSGLATPAPTVQAPAPTPAAPKPPVAPAPAAPIAPPAPKPVTPPPTPAPVTPPKPATPPAPAPQKAAAPASTVTQPAQSRPQQAVPAWLQTPAAPAATPAPAQPQTPPAPKPVMPPAPAAPVVPPKPATPPAPVTPPMAPKPVTPPPAPAAPVVPPVPAALVTPPMTPKPVTPPSAPAPVTPAAPTPAPQASATPASVTPPIIVPPQDQPIAIIRADSLEKPEPPKGPQDA